MMLCTHMVNFASPSHEIHKAVANSPVGQVLAGPLFLKVKQNSIPYKASNKQNVWGDFWTFQLL